MQRRKLFIILQGIMTELQPVPIIHHNRFVEGFLAGQRPSLDRLNQLEEEVAAERAAWQSSGAVDQTLDELIQVYNRVGFPHHLENPKLRLEALRQLQTLIYGGLDNPKTGNIIGTAYRGFPLAVKNAIAGVNMKADEYSQAFKQAVRGLTTQRQTSSQPLVESWQQFMMEDYHNFEAFAQFLTADEFRKAREDERPFLDALQRQANILDATARNVVEATLVDLPLDLFTGFLTSTFNEAGLRNPRLDTIWKWFKFAFHPQEVIDPELILGKLADGAPFPEDLKSLLREFLSRSLAQHVRVTKESLSVYREPPTPKFGLDSTMVVTKKRQGSDFRTTRTTLKTGDEIVPVSPDQPTYQLRLGSRVSPSEDELSRFVQKTADNFARGDQRMRKDIHDIVESLVQDPFGLGVGKLSVMEVTSEDGLRRLPLRRFRPDQRIPLEHPESRRIRAVYYVDRKGAPNTVFLKEILSHEEFDTKYT